MFPWLDVFYTDPAQHLTTAVYDLNYLDHLFIDRDVSVQHLTVDGTFVR